jgi:hypothetical protein
MTGYDNWDDERARLLDGMSDADRERIAALLDNAAEAAKAGDLTSAARQLEEAREVMVGQNLFRSWDNGIWVFSSLIRLVRGMSPTKDVPIDYQRFLEAIPSANYDARMTDAQTAFWYGTPSAPVYGEIQPVGADTSASKPWVGWLIATALAAGFLYWLLA